MEVPQTLHQEEAAREAGDEELPEQGSPVEVQQALHQDEAAREAGDEELPERGSPVEVQQALHQEEAAREAGDEELLKRGSPVEVQLTDAGSHHATEDRAGYPVPGHRRWEPGEWHSELRENLGTEAGKELPKLRGCNRTADQSGECVACIWLFCIGPCQVQQRRRSRAQTQPEGRSRDLYPDHEEGAWARGTL